MSGSDGQWSDFDIRTLSAETLLRMSKSKDHWQKLMLAEFSI
jgi:hypothetical protein